MVILSGPQGSGVEKAALYCYRTISPSGNIDLPTVGPSGYTKYLGRPVRRRRNWKSPCGAR